MRNLIIILTPFLFMILVNELMRPGIHEKPYSIKGITAMNSNIRTVDKCSWNCHNDTRFCMDHHTAVLRPYFNIVNPFYFGMIYLLGATGNYGLANILFLVILWPLTMIILLVKTLNIQQKIIGLKKAKSGIHL